MKQTKAEILDEIFANDPYNLLDISQPRTKEEEEWRMANYPLGVLTLKTGEQFNIVEIDESKEYGADVEVYYNLQEKRKENSYCEGWYEKSDPIYAKKTGHGNWKELD